MSHDPPFRHAQNQEPSRPRHTHSAPRRLSGRRRLLRTAVAVGAAAILVPLTGTIAPATSTSSVLTAEAPSIGTSRASERPITGALHAAVDLVAAAEPPSDGDTLAPNTATNRTVDTAVKTPDTPSAAKSVAASAPCTVSATLVPSCGAWWGASVTGGGSRAAQLSAFEAKTGARTDIYHGYHRVGQMFPTREEIAIARDPKGKRILLLSLKPTGKYNWAQVAAGKEDAYLDNLARHIKTNYNEKFLMSVHHEPENDVMQAAGSGMTATDFRNMFRHVVQRLKGAGASNVLFVANFQGTQKFHTESWWPQMYPGDDVVDWLGWDSYSCVKPNPGQPCNDYAGTVNRRFSDSTPWPGFYNWAVKNHPSKPLIICELGVYDTGDNRKADFFRTATQQAPSYPNIKAIAYWDSGTQRQARLTPGSPAASAAGAFARSPLFAQMVP